MNEASTIYVAPPRSDRGPWRVSLRGRPDAELATEAEALKHSTDLAFAIENGGGFAVVKRERADGSWETIRE